MFDRTFQGLLYCKYRKIFNRRLFRIKDCLEYKNEKNRENLDFYLVKTGKNSNIYRTAPKFLKIKYKTGFY